MFVWVQWICKKDNNLERSRFDIIPSKPAALRMRKTSWHMKDSDILIVDIAHSRAFRPRRRGSMQAGGSKVYVPFQTKMQKVVEAVRTYMLEYYSVKPDTLTLECCTG